MDKTEECNDKYKTTIQYINNSRFKEVNHIYNAETDIEQVFRKIVVDYLKRHKLLD